MFGEDDINPSRPIHTEHTPPNLETDEQASMYFAQSERPQQTSREPFRLDSLRHLSPLNRGDNHIGGFLPTSKSSKPPQSVASINFSQLDDANSEALIRAYKKKKAELETLRDQFYQVETKFFTINQKHVLLEEENTTLKERVSQLEQQLKETQMREVRRESAESLQKQLQLKMKEVEVYQKEAAKQKADNAKLREKVKVLVARKSASSTSIDQDQQNKIQSNQPEIAHGELNSYF